MQLIMCDDRMADLVRIRNANAKRPVTLFVLYSGTWYSPLSSPEAFNAALWTPICPMLIPLPTPPPTIPRARPL